MKARANTFIYVRPKPHDGVWDRDYSKAKQSDILIGCFYATARDNYAANLNRYHAGLTADSESEPLLWNSAVENYGAYMDEMFQHCANQAIKDGHRLFLVLCENYKERLR